MSASLHTRTLPLLAAQKGRRSAGFILLENLMVAAFLALALGSLALLVSSQFQGSSDVDLLRQVDNSVNSDLGWFKTYAKLWKLCSGPYNVTYQQTGCTPPAGTASTSTITNSMNANVYEPSVDATTGLCTATKMALEFLKAAKTVSLNPARPNTNFTVPADASSSSTDAINTTLPKPNLNLYRKIEFVNSMPGLIQFTYILGPSATSPSATYNYTRIASVRLEASAWCP